MEMREDAFGYLLSEITGIFGVDAPAVQSHGTGIYSQNTRGEICVRKRIGERIMLIAGPGGRGNTVSPAIAEVSVQEMLSV